MNMPGGLPFFEGVPPFEWRIADLVVVKIATNPLYETEYGLPGGWYVVRNGRLVGESVILWENNERMMGFLGMEGNPKGDSQKPMPEQRTKKTPVVKGQK